MRKCPFCWQTENIQRLQYLLLGPCDKCLAGTHFSTVNLYGCVLQKHKIKLCAINMPHGAHINDFGYELPATVLNL